MLWKHSIPVECENPGKPLGSKRMTRGERLILDVMLEILTQIFE